MDFEFDHVHIICQHFPAMINYFERVFGAEVIFRDESHHGSPNVAMRLGRAKIFLRPVRPGENPAPSAPDSIMGLDHFSLAVKDASVAAAWLKNRGAEFVREPGATGMGGGVTALIRGPEDIRIELNERPEET